MRLNECEQVQKDLSEHLGINLTVVDASQQFLDGLKGIADPEKKRKFIGMITIGGFYRVSHRSHTHKAGIDL